MNVTICFTYFRSLTLSNLAAALYSIRRQDMALIDKIVIVDNNTTDSSSAIQEVIDSLDFPVMTHLLSYKHGDISKTHAWSTNTAVREAPDWLLFTRADYILDFDILRTFLAEVKTPIWNGFITGNVYHLGVDIGVCEETEWRETGTQRLRSLPGVENNYMSVDSGVWMARRESFDRVGGLDEGLSAWGHAQTLFQHRLYEVGTDFVHINRPLFFHPKHAGDRDIELANAQLRERGVDLRGIWDRYEGANPYR